jgi:hypothetical protein
MERAAIVEYDGGYPRLHAHLIACWCAARREGRAFDLTAWAFLPEAPALHAMLEESVK